MVRLRKYLKVSWQWDDNGWMGGWMSSPFFGGIWEIYYYWINQEINYQNQKWAFPPPKTYRHKLVYENMIDMILIRLIWIHVFLSVFCPYCDLIVIQLLLGFLFFYLGFSFEFIHKIYLLNFFYCCLLLVSFNMSNAFNFFISSSMHWSMWKFDFGMDLINKYNPSFVQMREKNYVW
jgi:hypothetical protein